ncbi:F0F1 ATP synthase subunit epsilon [Mangrovitalea sediminis]|uniref:F0F1 ATP synthase subunit epsilon n=1 Tax=Mangrovitalea sediminis TaxID=1982043 RepID=UPI0018E9F16E|nr:F0F1 ATP synthase subunit epsilon [Mangrovitalea sediminis]
MTGPVTQLRLKVLLPYRVLIDAVATKIIAEADNGFFCLKPRHVDMVAALAPGLLSYLNENNETVYLAVDEGVLVKCGDEVLVSTRDAVIGNDLASLQETVETRYRHLDEQERQARSAVARLEAGVVRRFIEMEKLLS